MLSSENPLARGIILDALKQTENDSVRKAICRALIEAGTGRGNVSEVDDFVQPLVGVLAADDPGTARLAAEATLIFEYEVVSEHLDKLIADSSLPLNTRLVAIYALELHPDMRAAIALLKLVDSVDAEVADEAEEALFALGISAGESSGDRRQIIEDLIAEGPTAFLQRRLIRKESLIRSAKTELTLWQGRYLSALGEVYGAISEDEERAKFLAGHLGGSETVVRLWALERIRQDRVGTRPNPKLPAAVGPILVVLVSDGDKRVRLKTAAVLSFMTEVNSAEQLLAQLEVEQDDQVRTELFGALGRACYIAFLPNSRQKIAPEIRKQTLDWAVKYLSDEVAAKAQKGAEVLRMLLEQDGLTDSQVEEYFGLLAAKYLSLKNEPDGALRGELLGTMGALCAPQSVHNKQSRRLFGPLFESALSDKTDSVRGAAVDGLTYIDKSAALKRLRKDFSGDPSEIIRKRIIALAAEVGGKEDLVWLMGRMGSNSESKLAWQAMLKIFNGSDSTVLSDWVERFGAGNGITGATESQRIAFFELARRKAVAENKPTMLKVVREKKQVILPDLLYVYLRWPQVDRAAALVENCLLSRDLDPNDVVVRALDGYLAEPPAGADPNVLVEALSKIRAPQARPLWQDRLKQWLIRFGRAKATIKNGPDGT